MKKNLFPEVSRFFVAVSFLILCLFPLSVAVGQKSAPPEENRKAGERMTLKIKDVEYAFRWCPAGTFLMGSPMNEKGRNDNETQHQVTLSCGFWMLETEVTQAMWESVMGDNPSKFKGGKLPVEQVSWYDCLKYIRELNDLFADTPGAPADFKFALPTEAQWEYACRAGTKTAYHFGNVLPVEHANVSEMKVKQTREVGKYPANAWGLKDMHGNVYEWCADSRRDYSNGAVTDPLGPNHGALRGGSWLYSAENSRSARRYGFNPSAGTDNVGLRLALVSEAVWPTPASPPAVASTANSAKDDHKPGDRMTLKIKDVEYAFRWCPAGTFMMGSPENEKGRNDKETQHQVTLSCGFWMLETEVTQAMWDSVMEDNPSEFKGEKLPVEHVSWNDCLKYIRQLNDLFADTPGVPAGFKFALPTEAQWEYACRAGTRTAYYFGNILPVEYANVSDMGVKRTREVGKYPANAWGLKDMHGNVYEWCADVWGDYPSGAVTDPMGPNTGSGRVLRGGSWLYASENSRSASRYGISQSAGTDNTGLRLVLVSEAR